MKGKAPGWTGAFPFAIKRRPLRQVPPHSRTERTQVRVVLTAQAVRAAFRRCRGIHISPFRRRSPSILPFWHVMPWSLHFTARKRKVAKKRGRRPGEKSLSPERRAASVLLSALPAPPPGSVSPSRSSVERPIQCAAGKMKKAAHTVRPAPAPGPLTLARTFLIHFDDCIKKNHSSAYTLHSLVCVHPVTCNRGAFTGATPPAHNCKNPKRASQKEADTTFPKCTYTHFSRLASSYMS